MKPEKAIERQCMAWLRSQGIFCTITESKGTYNVARRAFMANTNPYRMNGLPDAMAIIEGIYVGIEFKAPKGRQSETQKEFQAGVEAAGGVYWLIRSLDELKERIRSYRIVSCTSL